VTLEPPLSSSYLKSPEKNTEPTVSSGGK
jgi:hypothetical protein